MNGLAIVANAGPRFLDRRIRIRGGNAGMPGKNETRQHRGKNGVPPHAARIRPRKNPRTPHPWPMPPDANRRQAVLRNCLMCGGTPLWAASYIDLSRPSDAGREGIRRI